MLGQIRLLLAASVLLAVLSSHGRLAAVLAAATYFAWGAQLLLRGQAASSGRALHWLDLLWISVLVAATGPAQSTYFMAYLFAILSASFCHGKSEGVRVSVAAVVSYMGLFALQAGAGDAVQALMRASFLLVTGYMSAHWGEARLAYARRLALLRDLSRPSNVRLGWETTLYNALHGIRDFHRARSCVLVTGSVDRQNGCLRRVGQDGERSQQTTVIDAAIVQALLLESEGAVFSHRRRAGDDAHWLRLQACTVLLDYSHFISVPVTCRGETGRLYLLGQRRMDAVEADFLQQAADQAMALVDNISLLDSLATEAAIGERRRLGWTVHDDVIQPCIGLQFGLIALRQKAEAGESIVHEIDRLMSATEDAVHTLREYSGRIVNTATPQDPPILSGLRRRIEQAQNLHGLQAELQVQGQAGELPDRLAAEMLHMASEALANVGRHSQARSARLRLQYEAGMATLAIEDDGRFPPGGFLPRSIAGRAAALGGRGWAEATQSGGTRVNIEVPV